jgi:hypothetical protein
VRLRRPALCAGVAALLTLSVPSAPGAPVQEDGADPAYTFVSANSGADGVRIHFDVVGFLPVTPALSLGSVTAEAFVESTRRSAVALLPDPGGTIVSAPGLAAGLVGVPNVPGYPLIARAEDPFVPSAEASPVQGAGLGVIRAEASADRAAASARAGRVGAGDGLTGLAPVNELLGALVDQLDLPLGGPLLDLGTAQVDVEEVRTGPAQLQATATTRLSGVRLLGGLVRIASIETTAAAALDGATATAEPPTVEVAGVTVAGVPATLTEEGLSLAGSASPLGGLLAPLTDPLLEQGLALRVAPSEARVEGTTARARSGGVTIEVTSEYQGYPVVLRVTLGEARASVQGSGLRRAGTPDVTPPSPPVLVPGAPTGAALPDLTPPAVATPPAVGPAPVTPATTPIAEVLDLRRLYPFLAILAGLLAGSRLVASSLLRRRPGATPEVRQLFRW